MNAMSFMVAQATGEKPPKLSATMRANPSTSRRNEVLQLIRDCDGITQVRMQRELGMPEPQLRRYLRMLVDGAQAYFDGRVWRAAE